MLSPVSRRSHEFSQNCDFNCLFILTIRIINVIIITVSSRPYNGGDIMETNLNYNDIMLIIQVFLLIIALIDLYYTSGR